MALGEIIQIGTLICLFISSLLLLIWIYRPKSKELYDKYSKIALKEDKRITKKK
jgi:cbb3-type cytochrome oxidase subunit 3